MCCILHNYINFVYLKKIKMKNSDKIFRLMNHDSSHKQPRFESFTIEELNKEFGTNYKSIDEAVQADPEYLFIHEDMIEYLK